MQLRHTPDRPFHLPESFRQQWPEPFGSMLTGRIEELTRLNRLNDVYASISARDSAQTFFARALDVLQVGIRCTETDLAQIPREGPFVLVANHPFGMVEGVILGKILSEIRPDFKFLGNFLIDQMPELRALNISVDPFGTKEAMRKNVAPLREALRFLRHGGALIIFPAGEVAHLDLRQRRVTDPPWNANVAGIIRSARVPVLPLFFDGTNSLLFQTLGLAHPRLRTMMLPNELLNKQHKEIHLHIGRLIPAERLAKMSSSTEVIDYLRMRTYLLQQAEIKPLTRKKSFFTSRSLDSTKSLEVIAQADDVHLLTQEIAALDSSHLLCESGEFQVFAAKAARIPHLLFEIGRQREIAFRATGEGCGRCVDLDDFDEYYQHLFLWNRERQELVGAYRLGEVDTILQRFGIKGLYTHTLFRYNASLIHQLGPVLELGRSFIRPEYQRNYSPLLLLWKGIGQYVVRHPQYRYLYGPVSISDAYSTVSRQLMVAFLRENHLLPELSKQVKPRQGMRMKAMPEMDPHRCLHGITNLEKLAELIKDCEQDEKNIPVLLKQYLKLGGCLLGFNVDAKFSNVVDGLILVDLLQTEPRLLEKYFSKEGLESFYAFHER